MPPKSTTDDQRHDLSPEPRPFTALCAARLAAVEVSGEKKPSGGRWRLNAGNEVLLRVWGLNMVPGGWGGEYPEPIRCVVDLSTAQFDGPKVRALVDHWDAMFAVAGWWTDGAVTDQGIDASLEWFSPKSQAAQEATKYVAVARELVEAGDPMEASVGIYPADNAMGPDGWELIAPGASVTVNGQTYTAGADRKDAPLYVLRNGRVYEASLVLWGADRGTGRLAARRQSPSLPLESRMSLSADRIAKLTEKHKGHEAVVLAALATPDITDEAIGQRVLEAEAASLKERLTAAEASNTALQGELAAAKAGAAPAPAKPVAPAPAAAAKLARAEGEAGRLPGSSSGTGEGDQPADIPAAMAALRAEGSKLSGFDLRSAALKRWPGLRDTIKV